MPKRKWLSKIYALISIVSWWLVWYLNGVGVIDDVTEVSLIMVLIIVGFEGTVALNEYEKKNERRGQSCRR
jgi:hypothetical protein